MTTYGRFLFRLIPRYLLSTPVFLKDNTLAFTRQGKIATSNVSALHKLSHGSMHYLTTNKQANSQYNQCAYWQLYCYRYISRTMRFDIVVVIKDIL
jgi:hypothetical protein